MMKTVGILLAGGMSRRYGSPKAFAQYQGEFFYKYVYHVLDAVCDAVVIVTNERLLHRFPTYLDVVIDCEEYKGEGPLAGIYTAMLKCPAERYVVLPCDMPFMTEAVLSSFLHQADDHAACAIRIKEQLHPLVCSLSATVLPILQTQLAAGQNGVIAFLEAAGVEWIDGATLTDHHTEVFRNLNRPDQINYSLS